MLTRQHAELEVTVSRVRARTALEEQLVEECLAMASYALGSGKPIPSKVAEIVQEWLLPANPGAASDSPRQADVGRLAWAHAQLTQLIAPAAPRAVLLLAPERDRKTPPSTFGPIRLVRYLMIISLVSLLCLLLLGATEQVTFVGSTTNLAQLVGLASILNAASLLCAASIGASFSALFRVNLYIAATTYDAKYDVSYWVQYGLGLIAGTLLATLIPVNDPSGSITRPILALVGGFSASLLYRVLDRFSRSIESVVGLEPTEQMLTRGAAVGATDAHAQDMQQTLEQLVKLLGEAQTSRAEGTPLQTTVSPWLADGSKPSRASTTGMQQS